MRPVPAIAATATADPSAPVDRASAARFVDREVVPRVAEYERAGRVPEDLLASVSAAGLWAPFLPVEAGGQGIDLLTLGAVHEEVGRGCSSLRSLLTVHTMVAWAVQRWGDTGQRTRWLTGLASGSVLGAFCLTEPEVGSDATQISTSARRRGSDWVLTGIKRWITNGQRADLFLVLARTERGVAAFLVPRDAPGVEVVPIDGMLGTRSSMLAEVRLRDAVAGPDALLGPDGFAAGMVMTGVLDLGRYSVAAGSVGIVQACVDACAEYTTSRRVGGGPLRDLQLIRARLTDMVTDLYAARALCDRAGRLKDAGAADSLMATFIAKYFASQAAARHASAAVQIHGAAGCAEDAPVARFYRDAKVMEIIEGSTEIQQITIADEVFRRVVR
ncbi:acyl-CoA dehydrogenase family protein [Plantactinospora sp. S1510]|uniref:Acyl-CoA dehydrogenase family protein n=1 Tax=Plantactinospora alkalitolerans TaxID=2789879 RepID=A0ABS0H2X8_9ACTN|nr:acyl-CoA dehydrogenase family protein [Plantactinospora alkalitolerans]MBF9132817.1 acyl-CoA dehydrogenase family protein [Plantactinospora alkalitolerans]